jgi:hypothetical protein
MKLAIMQPYFLPYIGYFQLINAVDTFVVYDNVQYQKKSWINRNRYLLNRKDHIFSLVLKNDSTFLNINERYLSNVFDRNKLISQLSNAYRKAPYFGETMGVFREIVNFDKINLAEYIHHSIISICTHIGITTTIMRSSIINVDHSLKSENKVIAICQALDTKTYINAIGGVNLYSKESFADKAIELKFIKSKPIEYKQFDNEFVPWLSIMDVLMFNSIDKVRLFLQEYELL